MLSVCPRDVLDEIWDLIEAVSESVSTCSFIFKFCLQEWKDDKKDRGVEYKYAWNKDMFDEIDPRYIDYVLGMHVFIMLSIKKFRTGPVTSLRSAILAPGRRS